MSTTCEEACVLEPKGLHVGPSPSHLIASISRISAGIPPLRSIPYVCKGCRSARVERDNKQRACPPHEEAMHDLFRTGKTPYDDVVSFSKVNALKECGPVEASHEYWPLRTWA
jgi:hypothetical protein